MSDIQWPDPHSLPFTLTPRNEERVMIAVDVEPQSTTVAEQFTPHGLQFRIIYKSDLPKVQALVQDAACKARLAMARQMWDQEFTRHLKDCGGDEAMARASIGPSPESFYDSLPGGKGGRPPLLSLRVCPDPIAAPHTPEAAQEQSIERLARILGESMGRAQKNDQRK